MIVKYMILTFFMILMIKPESSLEIIKLTLSCIFCLGLLGVTLAGQELVITHAPSYVTFQQQSEHLQTSQVPKVVAHTLGLKTDTAVS